MSDHRYVNQAWDDGGPLCPMEGTHPAHRAVVAVQDAYHSAMPTDEDGEYSPEHDALLATARKHRGLRSGMDLYQVSTSTATIPTTVVQAWYFKCPVCLFVLPATSAGPVR